MILKQMNMKKRVEYCKKLFKNFGEQSYIEPPFHCDYGYNINIGKRCIFNFNNIILDCGKVTIGDDCLFSPNCNIITVTQPVNYKARKNGMEYTKPIKIGNDCFFGAGSMILPGVTIGDRVITGAGSVIINDVPSDCIVSGNPAKIIKKINESNEKEINNEKNK